MTSYTTIANSEIDQDSPVTEPLLTKLRDNPIALAEQATGAPRIMRKRYTANNATLTITDLDGFHGFTWSATVSNGSVSLNGIRIELSTDGGSSWGSAQSFGPLDARDTINNAVSAGYVDLLTGDYFGHGIRTSGTSPERNNGTLTGASSSVDAIRFTESAGTVSWSLVIELDGGAA